MKSYPTVSTQPPAQAAAPIEGAFGKLTELLDRNCALAQSIRSKLIGAVPAPPKGTEVTRDGYLGQLDRMIDMAECEGEELQAASQAL